MRVLGYDVEYRVTRDGHNQTWLVKGDKEVLLGGGRFTNREDIEYLMWALDLEDAMELGITRDMVWERYEKGLDHAVEFISGGDDRGETIARVVGEICATEGVDPESLDGQAIAECVAEYVEFHAGEEE